MSDDVVDAKDFKIQNLERMVADRDQEIARLNQQKLNARYFAILGYERIIKALDGELEKPILKSITDES